MALLNQFSPQALDPVALIGDWSFNRTILDRRSDQVSGATGEATLAWRSSDEIRWSERGRLDHQGARLPFRRVYLMRRDSEGWQVTFEDGRPFHPWIPGRLVTHPCGPDLYIGVVEADPADPLSWMTRWTIRGPHKELEVSTRLSRP